MRSEAAVEAARRRLRRQQVIGIGVVAGLFAILAAVLVVVVLVSGRPDDGTGAAPPSSGEPLWRTVAPFVLMAISFALGCVTIVGTVRAKYFESARRANAALQSLPRHERKQLLRQVRGLHTADPGQLAVTREVARSRVDQRFLVNVLFGTALLAVAMVIITRPEGGAVTIVLPALDLLLVGVGAPFMIREVRRARRFLRQNPLPEAGADRSVDPDLSVTSTKGTDRG